RDAGAPVVGNICVLACYRIERNPASRSPLIAHTLADRIETTGRGDRERRDRARLGRGNGGAGTEGLAEDQVLSLVERKAEIGGQRRPRGLRHGGFAERSVFSDRKDVDGVGP